MGADAKRLPSDTFLATQLTQVLPLIKRPLIRRSGEHSIEKHLRMPSLNCLPVICLADLNLGGVGLPP